MIPSPRWFPVWFPVWLPGWFPGWFLGMRMIFLYYESTVSEIDLPVLISLEGFFR
jgi:hypothetical protein